MTHLRKSLGSKTFDAANALILLGLVFATVYPLWYIAAVSISDGTAVNRGDVKLWPIDITFEAYATVFRNQDIWRSYLNTIIYTGVGTAINLAATALCAYPLSWKDFFGNAFFTVFITITIPGCSLGRRTPLLPARTASSPTWTTLQCGPPAG